VSATASASPTGCPACGGELLPWIEVAAGEPSEQRRFRLLRCSRCASAVTAGPPAGPKAYAEGVYAPGSPRALPAIRLFQRATVGQPVRMLERAGLPRGARVLDAGAGRGRLVYELLRRGYAASGIEPAARGAAAARAAGRPVEQRAIEEHEDEGLDGVVLWHVLEHLDDPHAALRRAWSWLRPGGVLLVGVPNAASLQARIGAEGWLHWDAPRHRVHLTPAGAKALLGATRFEPVRVHHHVWEHNPAGMWMAVLARAGMTPGFPFHLLKRNVPARPRDLALLALGAPLAPFTTGLEALAASAGRGGTIAVEARRA
jgi:SAM-dependent methyltransferase